MSKLVKTVVVVGIPGVGKTTVLNIAVNELLAKGYVVKVINFGDYMLQELIQQGLVRSRDEIRLLPLKIQREVQERVAKRIRYEIDSERDLHGESIFFIDTHAVVKTSTGYWSGLPYHVVKYLMPDIIVVIEASVDEILSRHVRDKSRERSDYGDPKLLSDLLMMNRVFTISSATLVGAPVYILCNREGSAKETALELVNVIINRLRV